MESSQPSKPFDDALLEFVCERFQLGRFIRFDGMLGGSFNVNMKMTTSDGTFAVRVLNRSAAPEHLGHARQAIALLRANGIPAACPLTAVGGDPFIRYKEKTGTGDSVRKRGFVSMQRSAGFLRAPAC